MGKSFAEFEFLDRNQGEMVEKIARVLANLFTVQENSMQFLSSSVI